MTERKFPYDWSPAQKGDHPHDNRDYEIDLGGGRLPKGRINIDRHGDADVFIDFDKQIILENDVRYILEYPRLPFEDDSIEGIITHHCLEHIGGGFLHLMDECYRVLKPGELFRIIVPAFPSYSAVNDPDHKRYFVKDTFNSFLGTDTEYLTDAYSEPYTKCRFEMVDYQEHELNPPWVRWTPEDVREIRITLRKRSN